MKKYKLSVYKNIDERLERSWQKLWSCSKYSNFFNSVDFFKLCLKTFDIEDYYVFCVSDNYKLLAVAPLIKDRIFGFNAFVNPGKPFLEKSPLLVKENDKEILRYLIKFILKKGSVHLSEVPEEVAISLKLLFPDSCTSIISANPYIDLRDDPFSHLSGEHLKRIERKMKKNAGKIRHIHLKKNLDKQIEAVFDLEEKSYKKVNRKEIFNSVMARNFYRNLTSDCAKYALIDFLEFNGEKFVSLTGIIAGKHYYAYHTSYLRKFRGLMPGKLILFYTLRKLRDEGVEILDLGRGLNAFKEEFTKEFLFQYDFYLAENHLLNAWWKFVNSVRRFRIGLVGTRNSKDCNFLFKSIKAYEYS